MPGRVIYVVRSWPRLSQTFVLNEVLAMERRGVELTIFSLVRSGERVVHPQVSEVRAPVWYLDDERARTPATTVRRHAARLLRAPLPYARTLALCLRRPDLAAGYGECSTTEAFGMAVTIAQAVDGMRSRGSAPAHLHAHFAHDPALVGMLAAGLTGLPFTFTAHARDLIQTPGPALAARTSRAEAVVTCCAVNADYIDTVVPGGCRPPVRVVHHGVDTRRFRPRHRPGVDGVEVDAAGVDAADGVPTVVSVGRLVEKKGFTDLLNALRRVVDGGRRLRCEIYGDGPDRDRLIALTELLGLADDVDFLGARDGEGIIEALGHADLFLLTPRVAGDGDRDGIPNVLVEAMSCGLAVVTTRAGGVSELVEHGVNGLLAEPGDVATVAALVGELLDDAQRRRRLGLAARATVESAYDVDAAAAELERLMLPARTPEPEVAP